MSRALFSLSSVRLFVTLVPCALFSVSSVGLFVTLKPCALFSVTSDALFVTLVSCALFFEFCYIVMSMPCEVFSLSSV